jgi:putative transposase
MQGPLAMHREDHDAFERLPSAALQEHPTCLPAYCLMPNHWHFVVWPQREGERTACTQWLTNPPTRR